MQNLQDTQNRVACWTDELLTQALAGMARRYGTGVTEADDQELRRLILANTEEKDAAETSLFWSREILHELRRRVKTGKITWPPEDSRE
ncbi:MAG: hypothetical protein LBP20_00115 [Treponema sp.]|jgi:hypothetical protein|nr:hypothetical protein [Treponema sp.]